ncbi:MAG: tetratricopeptide repeat protein [Candidatus Scalindua sp.]|nr:tetratricopeptide repeat protein [Candidatus Scalindua sp.]
MSNIGNALQIALKHHQAGQLQDAVSIYDQILQENPNHPDALNLSGLIAHQTNNNVKAAELINKAILNNPENPDYYYNLGIVLSALEKWKEAIHAYRQAIRLKPDYFEALNNLGNILREHSNTDSAIEIYNKALKLKPDCVEVWNNLGNVLKVQGKIENAIENYKKAIQIKPNYAEAWNNLGSAISAQNRFKDAIEHYRHALKLKPDYAEAWSNLGGVMEIIGEFNTSIESYRQALKYKPIAFSNLLYLLSYNVVCSPEQILEEHRNWGRIHEEKQKTDNFSHTKSTDPNKRLRIGYVSSDFRKHALSFFFEPILKNHDKSHVETYCYSNVNEPDDITERLKTMADEWCSTLEMNDSEVAQKIYDDKIDILIDLAGHTAKNRLIIFSYKPAPVQITYLGYCNTTGLKSMDYWITDTVLHPEDTVELAAEDIVRLQRCWTCYQPPVDAPEVKPDMPANKIITFGSFNNVSKLNKKVIECWSQLLKDVANSRLVLKARQLADPFIQERISTQFAQNGINNEQLTLLPSTPSYMADYNRIDIALDTFPRTGGVTTADSLWMGVPVITLAGQRYIERQGASILKAIGLDELITSTPEEYIAKAVTLAKDHKQRTELKASLRELMTNSPLCDGRDLAQALEITYRKMWHTWCEKE